jgi:hypothetical protein
MTGSLLLNPKEIERYARAVFHLSNGCCFVFNDRRRLGVLRERAAAWLEAQVYRDLPGICYREYA